MAIQKEVYRMLDTAGDGTGTTNASGDYSATVTDFYITDPNTPFYIHRMLIQVEDAGAFATSGYGALAGLSTGIDVLQLDPSGNIQVSYTDSHLIKSNNDWARKCYDVKLENWATGNGAIHVRWTFARSGEPIRIAKDYSFVVRLNDNFTGLVTHYFMVEGHS